jgi:hypothetical protein
MEDLNFVHTVRAGAESSSHATMPQGRSQKAIRDSLSDGGLSRDVANKRQESWLDHCEI